MKSSRFPSILVLTIVALTLAACDSNPGPAAPQPTTASSQATAAPTMDMGGMEGMSTPVGMDVLDDVTYIDMMIPHHQLAVDMAKIAQEKATRGELKGLANDIIRAQEDEIKRMGGWRNELAGSATPNPDMSTAMGGMAGMDVDLEKLKASPNFDADFITAMIPHHQTAIGMSTDALPYLKKGELRDLARDIITTQQTEIDRMNGWLEEWK